MPLVPSPGTGYPDGQRLDNYDSGPLWNLGSVVDSTVKQSPVMNMQHFAAAGGYIISAAGICTCTMTWYADALLANIMSSKTFQLDHNVPATFGGMLIPNLGPFLQVTCSPIAGGAFGINALVIGSNRDSPIPWIPQNPVLIDQQSGSTPASGATQVYPSDYYAGPVWVQYATGADTFVQLQYLNSAGVYDLQAEQRPATPFLFSGVMVTPSGAWRVNVVNNTGAGITWNLIVTPTLTGAT